MLTYKSVHVQNPVAGIDLGEGGDIYREAPIGEHDAEHFSLSGFGYWVSGFGFRRF